MSDSDPELATIAERTGERLRELGWMMAAAESCTGGWLAKVATDIPGSSRWFERGFVTYTNDAKREMLGVRAATLDEHGAVSEATVTEMAEGAIAHSHARVAVAISGIAGPGGATPYKPVGTVCFAWAAVGRPTRVRTDHFAGDRAAVRRQSVAAGLTGILDVLADA